MSYIGREEKGPDEYFKKFSGAVEARKLFETYESAAASSLRHLGRIENLLSGKPPYSPEKLKTLGYGDMANYNTREAMQRARRKVRSRVDLMISTNSLVKTNIPQTEFEGTESERIEVENILEEEVKTLFRKAGLKKVRLHRTRSSVEKGAGIVFFPNKEDFRPVNAERGRCFVEKNAPMDPRGWDCFFIADSRKPFSLMQVLEAPGWEGPEEKNQHLRGWNREAVREALYNSQNPDAATDPEKAYDVSKWEVFAKSLKMGSTAAESRVMSQKIPVVHLYQRNTRGGVDRYMFAQEGTGKSFMLWEEDAYEDFNQCVHVLYYDNLQEHYWEAEGLGHEVFDLELVQLRLLNRTIDNIDLVMTPVWKHSTSPDHQGRRTRGKRSKPIQIDRFIHVNENDDLDMLPNTSGAVSGPLAVKNYLDELSEGHVNGSQVSSSDRGSSKQPISSREAANIQAQISEQQVVEADSFYDQEDELLEEIIKRVLAPNYPKERRYGYHLVKQFLKRLEDRGVPSKFRKLKAIKHDRHDDSEKESYELPFDIHFERAIGAGSLQERMQRLQLGYRERGALSPKGRARISRDFFQELFGEDKANQYSGDISDKTENLPSKADDDIRQENCFFILGCDPGVAQDHNHQLHAGNHIAFVEDFIQKSQQPGPDGQPTIPPGKVLTILNYGNPHIARHIDEFRVQATTEELSKIHGDLTQRLTALEGYRKRLENDIKQEQEAAANEQQKQQQAILENINKVDSENRNLRISLMELQGKRDIQEREHQLKTRRDEERHAGETRRMEEKHELEKRRLDGDTT